MSSATSWSRAAAIEVVSRSWLSRMDGDRDGVGDELLPAHPLLAPVRRHAEPQRPVDQVEIEPVAVLVERRAEFRGNLGDGGGEAI